MKVQSAVAILIGMSGIFVNSVFLNKFEASGETNCEADTLVELIVNPRKLEVITESMGGGLYRYDYSDIKDYVRGFDRGADLAALQSISLNLLQVNDEKVARRALVFFNESLKTDTKLLLKKDRLLDVNRLLTEFSEKTLDIQARAVANECLAKTRHYSK